MGDVGLIAKLGASCPNALLLWRMNHVARTCYKFVIT